MNFVKILMEMVLQMPGLVMDGVMMVRGGLISSAKNIALIVVIVEMNFLIRMGIVTESLKVTASIMKDW